MPYGVKQHSSFYSPYSFCTKLIYNSSPQDAIDLKLEYNTQRVETCFESITMNFYVFLWFLPYVLIFNFIGAKVFLPEDDRSYDCANTQHMVWNIDSGFKVLKSKSDFEI